MIECSRQGRRIRIIGDTARLRIFPDVSDHNLEDLLHPVVFRIGENSRGCLQEIQPDLFTQIGLKIPLQTVKILLRDSAYIDSDRGTIRY